MKPPIYARQSATIKYMGFSLTLWMYMIYGSSELLELEDVELSLSDDEVVEEGVPSSLESSGI